MADIYHTFLDDEQEAEYHFRKAHGADKCAVCGGEGGKRRTTGGYQTFVMCEACDGLGYERVTLYTLTGYVPDNEDYPILATDNNWGAWGVEVDQHILMGILQRFAPYAYAAEMRRQGVTL